MNPNRKIKARNFNRQPWWFKAINGSWRALYPFGTKPKLDKDNLIKAAWKATGLQDMGSLFWDEPLEHLLYSINNEARLHPIGYYITRQRLINLLAVRLRAEALFKKHPEILEQQLYPVMLVIGLQRTGTTKLQRLLASDPKNRALLSWEAINPAPFSDKQNENKKRVKMAKLSEQALKMMSPGFFAIHPVEHQSPEEDVLLLDVSFMSTTAEATMHVPTYASWLEQTDQSLAYEYMARLMKLLQWQRQGKRWVLKTPHHMEFLDLVDKHFGEVQYIWTHRNVYESIPSFLSMVAYSRVIFSDKVNKMEVADHWVRKTGVMLSKALEFHEKNNHKSLFSDIQYVDLLEDSIKVIHQIYKDRNEQISTELEKHFISSNHQNFKGKYGQHIYSLNDFGINGNLIDQYTKEYQLFQEKMKTR